MATLYELREDLRTVIDGGLIFDEESGEILFDAQNLDELRAAFDEKLEACALFLKNLNAEAAAIKAEEQALAARRRQAERKAERLGAYITDCLQDKVDAHKFSTPRVALSLRKSESVVISDVSALHPGFLTIKTTETPNKTAIKAAIKRGEAVSGAVLVENANLQVR